MATRHNNNFMLLVLPALAFPRPQLEKKSTRENFFHTIKRRRDKAKMIQPEISSLLSKRILIRKEWW